MKKPHPPQCANIDGLRKTRMQQQLGNEILRLQRQLQALQTTADAADFEMVNSYKMMLHNRNCMLAEINNVSPMRL